MRNHAGAAFGLIALLLVAACDDRAPTAPDAVIGADAALAEVVSLNAAPLTLGWLAPLGTATSAAPHELTLRPLVTICRWKDNECAGNPVARFEIGSGLVANAAAFTAEWNIAVSGVASGRTTYRITVTNGGTRVGVAVFVDVARGRWALSVPGQSPALTAASSITLQFRLGEQTAPPPPLATVVEGLASASTQFLPVLSGDTRSTEQTAALTTLANTLTSLQTALTGPSEQALLAFSQARRAADEAFNIAVPGDRAELDVIRLELDQVGLLLGSSG